MRYLLLLISIFLGEALAAPAVAPREQFVQANTLYEQRKYKEAIQAYTAIQSQKLVSPNLLFNLGNAYFRNGEIGRAVFNFRRAELLAPRDPDIQANLSFARDSAGAAALHGPARRLLFYFTLNELTAATVILFWCFSAIFIAVLLKPSLKPSLRSMIAWSGAAFFLALTWTSISFYARSRPEAVIIASQAEVRYGPLEESQTAFTARDGTEFRVLGSVSGWLQISDSAKRTGWVKTSQAALISG